MPDSAPQLLVVAHTHWDREWYHTAERFRQRLVALVDELLDEPPPEGASFLLDGQAVLLDDYLAVRPERAAELSRLLRDGRIEAGPWYVLADELIPGGEALVRNLLAGRDAVRQLRGEPPPVLYCPDSFGHPAVLPELAEGFGCTLVVLWRGYGGARWPSGDTVRWRGPSGAETIVCHLPPDGYEFGSSLPLTREGAAERWRRVESVMLPRLRTGAGLLLNGADHHARQRGQAQAVALLAQAAHPVVVTATSLGRAADRIAGAASASALPTVAGELRDSYGYTWTLGGTLATRASQKRHNARVERTLVRDVEPWLALGAASAGSVALLRAGWRDLLRGHPHDTLCGTSIDAVADALDQRLAAAEGQAAGLRADALAALLAHDAERARHEPASWRPALVLRNRSARPRGGVAEVTLAEKLADVAVGPGSATRQGAVREPDGLPEGVQPLSSDRVVRLTESPRAYPDADLVEETRALAWVETIGGYTVETRLIGDATFGAAPPRAVTATPGVMDNGLLRVAVDDRGRVRIATSSGDRVVDDALRLEAHRDVGDLYTPAIRERLDLFAVSSVTTTLAGPLRAEVMIRFHDRDEVQGITLRLQLDAGLAALRVLVSGTNSARDARIRIVAAGDLVGGDAVERSTPQGEDDVTPGVAVHSEFGGAPHVDRDVATIADAAFHPVARTIPAISASDAAMEHVVRTAPLHRYVSRYAPDRGMSVVSDGLAEYESLPDGAVAITLLRAVGALSRTDLPERPGHAGWPAETPGAQCAGPFEACVAIALHGPDTPAQRDHVDALAEDVLLPLAGETLRSNLADAHVAGGLELEGDGLAFSAAMPAREPGWITLRCVNRRDAAVRGAWRLRRTVAAAHRARLDEARGEALNVSGGSILFDARPLEILTIVARLT